MQSSRPSVDVRVEGHVLVVTIDRPEVRNAIDREVATFIAAAMDRLDDDNTLRVGVLTGAGGTFSAGADLRAWQRGEVPVVDRRGFGGLTARPPDTPLVAAVEGWAVGGGLELALACDLIVAAETARFGLPEVSRGLVASAGGMVNLPRRIPHAVAMHVLLTGEPLTATRAFDVGLVSTLSTEGEALDTALAIARRIAANGPLAVRTTKQVARESADWPAGSWPQLQLAAVEQVRASADATEGARAFTEKRAPVWDGS